MSTTFDASDYLIIDEAERFVDQLSRDELAIDEEKAKLFAITTAEKQTISLQEHRAALITRFKQILNETNLVEKWHTFIQSEEMREVRFKNLTQAAIDLVGFKEYLKAANLLIPGKSYQLKLTELEEKFKEALAAKKQAEEEKSESEGKMSRELNAILLAYERLKKCIISEMGERLGNEYIQKAISVSDANVWESKLEDTSNNEEKDKDE